MDALYAMRDLGVVAPAAGDAGDHRARAALAREIERLNRPAGSTRRSRAQMRRAPGVRAPRRRRRVALLVAAGFLVACSGVAVAVVVDPASTVQSASPAQLFADNPSDWNQDNLPNSNTPIAAGSVEQLSTITVPGVGAFQFWVAQRTDGQWCAGFRGPDGKWAGTDGQTNQSLSARTYDFGGDVPGCGDGGIWGHNRPPIHAGGPTFDMQGGGFHFSTDSMTPFIPGTTTPVSTETSWIFYGIIDNPGSATTVRDAVSGAATPILAHGTFALVLPLKDAAHVQLEAVDGSGDVITEAYPAGWHTALAPAQKAYLLARMRATKAELRAARLDGTPGRQHPRGR